MAIEWKTVTTVVIRLLVEQRENRVASAAVDVGKIRSSEQGLNNWENKATEEEEAAEEPPSAAAEEVAVAVREVPAAAAAYL